MQQRRDQRCRQYVEHPGEDHHEASDGTFLVAHLIGARGADTVSTHAQQIGHEEGAIAGLVMVFTGVLNVLAAPLIAALLHQL